MTDLKQYAGKLVTIERFILDQQADHPDATGVLTNILYDMALAAKMIASKTRQAGLAGILGSAEVENVQGEEVQKLDAYAQRTIYRLNDHTGRLAVMASEEEAEIIPIPERFKIGKYVLLYDPLDGSSNIDVNINVGTIFAVVRRKTYEGPGTLDDCLQPGRKLVAAGYIVYGASTMMVYATAGGGVHGFTLDPSIGEFLLSHPNIRMPETPRYYSANQGNEIHWSKGVQAYTQWLQRDVPEKKGLSLRYVGSLVADFHRNLLSGGVFYYPLDNRDPKKIEGKLRLLYEAAPLAFLAEQAGGYASDGEQAILDIEPTRLHQRVPLFIGNKMLVKKAEEFIREHDRMAVAA